MSHFPRVRLIIPLAAALALAFSAPSRAGTEHIPNGLSDFMGGVLPPPGFYWLNYLAYFQKDTIRDNNGDEPPGVDLDASVFVDAVRLVYMSPYKILGATWGAQVIFPLYMADVSVDVAGVGNVVDDDSKGVGDITINPFILAWHFSPNLHAGAGLDIVAPTGPYDDENPASQILNKNHWTFEPLVAVSYWQPGGIDLSAKIMYDFHTKNDEYEGNQELQPGQEFHVDYAASWGFAGDDWRAGVAGYYYQQMTDDEVEGDKVSDSKSRLAAIGPAVKWWPGKGRFSVTAKYLTEFAGENTNEGQSLWVNSVLAF